MKKRKKSRRHIGAINSSSIATSATAALIGGVGAVVVSKILERILPPSATQYSNYAALGSGLLLSTMTKNPHLQAAGLGAATVAASRVVGDLADGQSIGLLPPGTPMYNVTGTAGADTVDVL